ncbi:endonuclease/exonuclease/phosphatase family protein [Streptosporangium soli]|nr:endonuclease/exonuclease/phosphatase family protein [Streptosporangium sp. KLBMP 9127]
MLVGTATVWLVVVLVTRLFSGRWWLLMPLDLLPPLVYLAVPLILLVALPLVGVIRTSMRKWPRRLSVALALAALALGLPISGFSPSVLGRGESLALTGGMRVFAWNTEYWDQGGDPERFLNFLIAQRADIYLLQEYIYWNAATERAKPIDRLAELRRAFPGFSIATRGELITLSRFPIKAQPRVGPDRALHSAADFVTTFQAAKVLRTDLEVGDSRLSVYNVHLPVYEAVSARGLTLVRERHANWQAQLHGLMGDIERNNLPVLVAGDFNAGPANAAMGDLRARLREAVVSAGSSPYPTSWPAGRWWTWWRLDWVFYSAAAKPYRYELDDPAGLSDHRTQELLVSLEESQ